MTASPLPWHEVSNAEAVPSPALLVDPDRVAANIDRMIARVGGDCSRLRPHVKTHKMPEVMRLQLQAGITKFKCATIAEAEMAAASGAPDVLLAYQPVGPNVERLARLRDLFPETRFAAIADCEDVLHVLDRRFRDRPLRVFIDVDCGMGRTGVPVGEAASLHGLAESLAGLEAEGLHVYDGHLHDSDPAVREQRMMETFEPVHRLVDEIRPRAVIGGGSPTFGLHASRETWECSPGTTLFWDAGYGEKLPDLDFVPAAWLLARIISKPGAGKICLDLGHKAVAAENPLSRRARFPVWPHAEPVMQSEEHLVLALPEAAELPVGLPVAAVPIHICPTVALHAEAVVVRQGRATGEIWEIRARNRRITV
jgi:D-serine deaminase-like pyridoxal phosphate-dependent protein